MSILEDLQVVLETLDVPIETGVFSDAAPSKYMVIVPMSDSFDIHSDNLPCIDVQEARISIYSKGSYTALKNQVVQLLLDSSFTITARSYIGFEDDTGYYHYNVDVAKHYEIGGN
ncbi:TPA: hypothetical protein H9284_003081 [Listeria monocytogenes]|nr:hypothetical protein [Listeria monocytogenes]HAM1235708.1 hypothetical protein [Listeria monocytogenes]